MQLPILMKLAATYVATRMDIDFFGRGERIRTSGLYVPNVALHQAELHPAGSTEFKKSVIPVQ